MLGQPGRPDQPGALGEPGRADLCRGEQLIPIRAVQPGQLGRAVAIRIDDDPRVVLGRDVALVPCGQRGGQESPPGSPAGAPLRARCSPSSGLGLTSSSNTISDHYDNTVDDTPKSPFTGQAQVMS